MCCVDLDPGVKTKQTKAASDLHLGGGVHVFIREETGRCSLSSRFQHVEKINLNVPSKLPPKQPLFLTLMDEVWMHSGRSRPGRASHPCRSPEAPGVGPDRLCHLQTVNAAPQLQMGVIRRVR